MGMVGCSTCTACVSSGRWRRIGLLAAAWFGLSLAGCSTDPQAPVAAAITHGPTIAFESIDGPPETIFRTLVQDLSDEAVSRQMAVVSRDGPAQYRVRGYLAALVDGHRRATVISWVWDVYDADQHRALRITGEEPASTSGRGTWAAADERVLRRIAKDGMERLAAFLAAPDAGPSSLPEPPKRDPNVAAVDERPPGPAADTAALALSGDAR
jgi:hypothetical protein